MLVPVAALLLGALATVSVGVGLRAVHRELEPTRRACSDVSTALERAHTRLAGDRLALTRRLDALGGRGGTPRSTGRD